MSRAGLRRKVRYAGDVSATPTFVFLSMITQTTAMTNFDAPLNRLTMDPYQRKKKRFTRRTVPKKKVSTNKVFYQESIDEDTFLQQLGSLSVHQEDDVLYFDSDLNTNDSILDLDQMIAETSERWNRTVTAIVSNTVTANSTSSSALAGPTTISSRDNGMYANSPSVSSADSPQQKLSNETSLSLGMNVTRPSVITRQSSNGTIGTVGGMEHHLVIEQQQAEIEALHAALQAHQLQSAISFHRNSFHHPSHRGNPGMLVVHENAVVNGQMTFEPFRSDNDSNFDCVPVEHIQVNHDSDYWQDDLTVWSGFNTVSGPSENTNTQQSKLADSEDFVSIKDKSDKPVSNRRPDAESATGASALNGIPVRVVKDREVELSSGMSGVTKKALYSGTINAHTRLPEGQGTFLFVKTGDMYYGEVHDGEMHGAGTYTFGRSKSSKSKSNSRRKELRGTFDHNVFIG